VTFNVTNGNTPHFIGFFQIIGKAMEGGIVWYYHESNTNEEERIRHAS
jgi:hypothetical protein